MIEVNDGKIPDKLVDWLTETFYMNVGPAQIYHRDSDNHRRLWFRAGEYESEDEVFFWPHDREPTVADALTAIAAQRSITKT